MVSYLAKTPSLSVGLSSCLSICPSAHLCLSWAVCIVSHFLGLSDFFFRYFDYEELKPLLKGVVTKRMKHGAVLDLGCGVSYLFGDMLADGFDGSLTGIDYVSSVIRQQTKVYPVDLFPSIEFKECNALKLLSHFEKDSFSLIIDKATSDGMLCSPETAAKTPLMYKAVAQLLKLTGVYIIASVHAPEEEAWLSDLLLPSLVQACPQNKWLIQVHTPLDQDAAGDMENPFVYVIRKHGRFTRSASADDGKRGLEDAVAVQQFFYWKIN